MKSRIVAIGSWLFLSALYGCGDDSSPPESDAGVDGGPVSGSGGKGGKGGSGGKGGQGGGGKSGSNAQGGNGAGDDDTYSISGEVSGLNGSGLVLKLNDDEELEIDDNGDFTFDSKLAKDADYTVSVETQPADPLQACAVKEGNGKIDDSNIDNIKIECSDVTRSIGGSVSGLGGGQIKLKNNDGDELTVSADGNFTFQTPLKPGADYAVTVSSAPAGRTCSVTKGSGELGSGNVSDVNIACYAGLTIAANARVASVGLSWESNGATSYTVHRSTAADCDFANPNACAGHAEQANVTSPYNWLGLENGTVYYFAVVGNHPNDFKTRSSNRAGARPNGAELNGIVNAVVKGDNDTLYVGGQFTSVGPYTGPLAPIDRTTGATSRLPNFPIIPNALSESPVSAVVADGGGGYFVGGTFTLGSGPDTVSNLAHIRSDGTLDTIWKPNPNGNVSELTRVGGTLYLAGAFTTVFATPRAGVASVTTADAGTITAFDPNPTGGTVANLVANDTAVFVAGTFTSVGGQARAGLAQLGPSDGVATAWDPAPNTGPVAALALAGDALYVSGPFNIISGTARVRLAGFALSNGALLPDFAPQPEENNPPVAMAVAGDTLYLGGNFANITVGSNVSTRAKLAAVNRTTGAVSDWNPGADGIVESIAVDSDTVYVAGQFSNIGATPRKYLAAIQTSGAGSLTPWAPQPQAAVNGISVDSNTVYAYGGTVRSFGVESREKLAAFRGGSLTSWGPAVGGGDVLALAVSGANIYVGGTFDAVGGLTRHGAASISDTNAVRDWNAQLNDNGEVNAILVGNSRVYLGGSFTDGGGSARANLVSVNPDTGTRPDAWTLSGVNGRVHALALDGTSLFIGGAFGDVGGGTSRDKLAKLNADTGVADSWDPGGADALVRALAVVGDNVYIGGDFGNLATNTVRTRLAAVNKTTAALVAWSPALDDSVHTFAVLGNLLYVGGEFTTYATQGAQGVALINLGPEANEPFEFAPGAISISGFGPVYSLAVDNDRLYVGGDTRTVTNASSVTSRCWFYCAPGRPQPLP